MFKGIVSTVFGAAARLFANMQLVELFKAPRFHFDLECRAPDGSLRWVESFDNLVTTVGKNDLLTQYFKGSAYTATWFIGLIGAPDLVTPPTLSAADTMASHAGWTANTSYSQSTRPALTLGTASAGSIDNSASPASFSVSVDGFVSGAFITSDSTKSGTTGILYAEAAFAAIRQMFNGDTLAITAMLTAS